MPSLRSRFCTFRAVFLPGGKILRPTIASTTNTYLSPCLRNVAERFLNFNKRTWNCACAWRSFWSSCSKEGHKGGKTIATALTSSVQTASSLTTRPNLESLARTERSLLFYSNNKAPWRKHSDLLPIVKRLRNNFDDIFVVFVCVIRDSELMLVWEYAKELIIEECERWKNIPSGVHFCDLFFFFFLRSAKMLKLLLDSD